ncbi:MAG: hypothetical protein ISF22_06710 [Methanomassiliicoccus sp.]|nr:hypothetical protein [Methanomassiliicoccus sp.]
MSFIGIFGRKYEEERLEAYMLESFSSASQENSDRARDKLVKRAGSKPLETVTLMLKNYQHEDERVRTSIRATLTEMSPDRSVMTCILDDMVHPSRSVRKGVQRFLGDLIGPHATIYASSFEQTMLQVAMSRRKDIPVDDIAALAEQTKRTFMDGEVMESVRDIGFCLDSVRHRFRSSEQLKDYLSELLKMAPDLSRMGVYSGSIEEPLRKAMKAGRTRSFDDTREIIEERSNEAGLRRDLHVLIDEIGAVMDERPLMEASELTAEDRDELAGLRGLVRSIDGLVANEHHSKALIMLHGYVEGFLLGYMSGMKARVAAGDRSARYTLYAVGLACVKLASHVLPVSAEAVYQEGFRSREGAVSIFTVVLPEELTGVH